MIHGDRALIGRRVVKKRTKLDSLPHHFKRTDLVLVRTSLDETICVRPCTSCSGAGEVPSVEGANGFPHCCRQQAQEGRFVCLRCGESISSYEVHHLEKHGPTHLRPMQRICGSVVPDPASPPWTALYGKEARR